MEVIVYHNNCPDGWCAAFIAKTKYPEAELMGLDHGLLPEALEELFIYATGKDVLMIDYSLRTRELNDRLNAVAKSFRILDHHKTAQAALDGAGYATFDMKRSGAGLAWDYLFGVDSMGPYGEKCEDRPWWVNYTEDQDLWNWVLPRSQEVNAFLMVQPRTVDVWKSIIERFTVDAAAEAGIGVRAYVDYYTRSVIAEVQPGILRFQTGEIESEDGEIKLPTYADYRVGVVNIPYAGVSEAGNALVKDEGYQIGVAWFERGDGIIQFSLRSEKGGPVDCSAIAKGFGGGGHQSAAGFQISIQEGRDLVDKMLARPSYLDKILNDLAIQRECIVAKAEREANRSS